jgi:hypothetical protein
MAGAPGIGQVAHTARLVWRLCQLGQCNRALEPPRRIDHGGATDAGHLHETHGVGHVLRARDHETRLGHGMGGGDGGQEGP